VILQSTAGNEAKLSDNAMGCTTVGAILTVTVLVPILWISDFQPGFNACSCSLEQS
jgi:hypothetical protein